MKGSRSLGCLLGSSSAVNLGILHIVKLHVDEDVKPVAQKHRRVPFHLRDKVEAEITRLEEADIIEKVDFATGFHQL